MSISLIVTDMDGTLMDSDHVTVPERNVAALKAAKEQGVSIAIATGRPWCFTQQVVEQLGFVEYALVCNGAAVLDVRNNHWIMENGLEERLWRQALDVLREYDLPPMAYNRNGCFLERNAVGIAQERPLLTPEFQAQAEKSIAVVDRLEDALAGQAVEKLDTFFVSPALRKELVRRLEEIGPLYLASSLADNLEISSAAADKGTALAALCTQKGISADCVMAFGDGGNDIEMLRWAEWSFAMDNGGEAVKKAAKRLAPSNVEAGLGQMVERYVLQA